jgi:choline dehydrogenase-like flavoprotein
MNHDSDVIIVGSGAGGSAAAYKLARAGLRTLLLEKGGPLPLDGSTLDLQRVVKRGEFISHEHWSDAAGRTLIPEEHFNVGGKTKWYGAALLRFGAQEFEADAAHGCCGWPFGYAELTPYYSEAEQLLQVRPFECEPDLQRILQRAAPSGSSWRADPLTLGLSADIAQHPLEATHFDGFASPSGLKHDAENALLAPLRQLSNFSLISNAEVVALLGDERDARQVVGVRLRDGRELRSPRVLLACGALHSPRLLARYLAAHGLESQLPGATHIGRNLKLHLLTAMLAIGVRPISDLLRKTTVLTHAQYPHSSLQPLGFGADSLQTLLPKPLPQILRRGIARRAYGFFLQTEDGSAAANRVQDHGDTTPPTLDYDARRSPAALQEHQGFTRAVQRSLLRTGMLGFARRVGVQGTAHACGTLRCGNDPATSVVDAYGSVHGMRGLQVVDGSILPRSSRVNPALTIYAWGLRVGERLAAELARPD